MPSREARGEVFMPKRAFKSLNSRAAEKGEEVFASPRNAGGGSLRQIDRQITAGRELSFRVRTSRATERDTRGLSGDRPRDLARVEVLEGIQGCLAYYDTIARKRAELPYEIDGVICKVNELQWQGPLGFVSRAPRRAIAHKFPAQEELSVVKRIEFPGSVSGGTDDHMVIG